MSISFLQRAITFLPFFQLDNCSRCAVQRGERESTEERQSTCSGLWTGTLKRAQLAFFLQLSFWKACSACLYPFFFRYAATNFSICSPSIALPLSRSEWASDFRSCRFGKFARGMLGLNVWVWTQPLCLWKHFRPSSKPNTLLGLERRPKPKRQIMKWA